MNERELLVDCLRRLNRVGVIYYLTGSMASNYWGVPRTTHDLDFVVQLPMPAVPRIVQEFSRDFLHRGIGGAGGISTAPSVQCHRHPLRVEGISPAVSQRRADRSNLRFAAD